MAAHGGPHKSQSRFRARVARFRQINLPKPCTHHDALEFPNGTIVLDRLGRSSTALQMPVQRMLGKSAAKHGTSRPSFDWGHIGNEP